MFAHVNVLTEEKGLLCWSASYFLNLSCSSYLITFFQTSILAEVQESEGKSIRMERLTL